MINLESLSSSSLREFKDDIDGILEDRNKKNNFWVKNSILTGTCKGLNIKGLEKNDPIWQSCPGTGIRIRIDAFGNRDHVDLTCNDIKWLSDKLRLIAETIEESGEPYVY